MSLFRKPKKNIQRRAFSNFTDDPDQSTSKENDGDEKQTEGPKLKTRETPENHSKERQSSKTKTLLSFGDEEGEFTLQL